MRLDICRVCEALSCVLVTVDMVLATRWDEKEEELEEAMPRNKQLEELAIDFITYLRQNLLHKDRARS